jgi:hypothetical protein
MMESEPARQSLPSFFSMATMQLTAGAASMLVNGAHSDSQDINALSPSGKEFYSGLVQCEDDKDLRKLMGLEEFSPILQVQEITWLGTWCQFPTI